MRPATLRMMAILVSLLVISTGPLFAAAQLTNPMSGMCWDVVKNAQTYHCQQKCSSGPKIYFNGKNGDQGYCCSSWGSGGCPEPKPRGFCRIPKDMQGYATMLLGGHCIPTGCKNRGPCIRKTLGDISTIREILRASIPLGGPEGVQHNSP